MNVLITGAAGFIGFNLIADLVNDYNFELIIGVDNLNEYYDKELKFSRLKQLGINDISNAYYQKYISEKYKNFCFIKVDLNDNDNLGSIFKEYSFDIVINLAAQAGVRYSLLNPLSYVDNNIRGFTNLIELVHKNGIDNFIYASSSSVYGRSNNVPFNELQFVDKPVSIYAATKRSNELISFVYNDLYKIKMIGIRFFTVYGPFGRPDMAPFLFTKSIIEKKVINVFNNGNLKRDFTYVTNITEGIGNIVKYIVSEEQPINEIFNIGSSRPIDLMDFIYLLENEIGTKAAINFLPMQAGDVYETYADISKYERLFGRLERVTIEEGVRNFVIWYKEYYH